MGCGSSVATSTSTKKSQQKPIVKPEKLPPIRRQSSSDDERDKREENLEPFTVVCLDSSFDKNDANIRSIVDFLKCFNRQDKCEQFLLDFNETSLVFLLVSIEHAEELISNVHHLPRIYSVYVRQEDRRSRINEQQFRKQYPKVKGFFDEQRSLLEQLTVDVERSLSVADLVPLTIYSRLEAVQATPNSTEHLQFLFYQLFIHEFCLKATTKFNKDDFIDSLHGYYKNNRRLKTKLRKFDENYDPSENPLDCLDSKDFLRKILTQSLIKLNIPILFSIRFFIVDAFRSMIDQEQPFSSKSNYSAAGMSRFSYGKTSTEQIFYRAQALSKEKLDKIKANSGELLSMNNFIWASRNRQSSVKFLRENVNRNDLFVRVLFEIKVADGYSLKKRRPFIEFKSNVESTENHDGDPEHSNSVLFFIGSIFRIQGVAYDLNNESSTVQLILHDEQVNQSFPDLFDFLYEQKRSDYENIKALANILRQISPKSAEQFYKHLLEEDHQSSSTIECYRGLGLCAYSQNDFDQALRYFERALDLKPKEDSVKSSLYHNIGLVYAQKNQIDDALEHFNRALKTSSLPSHRACVHHNIALIHGQKGEHESELEHYEEALEIRERLNPNHQTQIASLYNNIGLTYCDLRQYERAESSLRKALEMRLKIFHANHVEVARSYANIGTLRTKTQELKSAIEYFDKALKILQNQNEPAEDDIKQLKANIKIINDKLRRKTY